MAESDTTFDQTPIAAADWPVSALSLAVEELLDQNGAFAFTDPEADGGSTFDSLIRQISPQRVAGIAALSRLVGMICPGLHSIFRSIAITFTHVREAGTLRHTGNPLDIALGNPDGWLTVQTPRGPRLTRAGHFQLSAAGAIVNEDGDALLDTTGRPLQTSPADTVLLIAGDGTLSSATGQIGRIGIVKADDPNKLSAEGGRLYAVSTPTQPLAGGQLIQGALEDSNVQPITELNRMMTDLREFQFTSEIVQSENDRQNNAVDKLLRKGV